MDMHLPGLQRTPALIDLKPILQELDKSTRLMHSMEELLNSHKNGYPLDLQSKSALQHVYSEFISIYASLIQNIESLDKSANEL